MSVPTPHFLLFSEANSKTGKETGKQQGQWRFVLEDIHGQSTLEASDTEPDAHGERLELLAVVRGLEALNEPAQVTLVTGSKYVSRGFRNGLPKWEENNWRWERYGHMVPVKNGDLWQRIHQALQYHQVNCRTWRFDAKSEVTGDSQVAELEETQQLPESKPLLVSNRSRLTTGAYQLKNRILKYLVSPFKSQRVGVASACE